MASVKVEDLLKNSLKDLREDDLKEFKWHLEKDHECIKKKDMENADILDTVDKMVACFGPEEAVKITVTILRKMNQNNLADQLEKKNKTGQPEGNMKTSAAVGAHSEEIRVIVPKTRNDLLQYSHQFTLDLNTVNTWLHLSEEKRVITGTYPEVQSYPDHPDRFDDYPQVLCRESVCGRCYWEIEWRGECVCISVSYKSISRKSDECVFGSNDQSWSLSCSPDSYSFWHNNIETDLPVKPISRRTGVWRIGVYVDYSAGTLSFYSVSDTLSLIHTVQTTFTHTLYPGFSVGSESSVTLC